MFWEETSCIIEEKDDDEPGVGGGETFGDDEVEETSPDEEEEGDDQQRRRLTELSSFEKSAEQQLGDLWWNLSVDLKPKIKFSSSTYIGISTKIALCPFKFLLHGSESVV